MNQQPNAPALRVMNLSHDPVGDLNALAYEGQPEKMRQYKHGYEDLFEFMPVLDKALLETTAPEVIDDFVKVVRQRMSYAGSKLARQGWIHENMPADFERWYVAVEAVTHKNNMKGGVEIVVAKWAKGISTPIHGHSAGFMHEQVLSGSMRVDIFRIIRPGVARLVRSHIVRAGEVITSVVMKAIPGHEDEKIYWVHRLTALEDTVTMNYLTEHPVDGRGNTFIAQGFDEVYKMKPTDVSPLPAGTKVSKEDVNPGDVILTRTPFGDCYSVTTQTKSFRAFHTEPNSLLDGLDTVDGFSNLKLSDTAAGWFRTFHGITLTDTDVMFDETNII